METEKCPECGEEVELWLVTISTMTEIVTREQQRNGVRRRTDIKRRTK